MNQQPLTAGSLPSPPPCRLEAVGLETFALSELFTSILIPGFFLLACILQLHYFHKPFMRITDLEHVTPLHRYGHVLANLAPEVHFINKEK